MKIQVFTLSFLGVIIIPIMIISPAQADFVHNQTTQVKLTVDSGSGTAEANRLNSFSVSGTGVSASDVLNTNQGTLNPNNQFTLAPNSNSFQLSINTLQADNTQTVSLSGDNLPAYSKVTINTPGVAGNLAGNVQNSLQGNITAGNSGTEATITSIFSLTVFSSGNNP